MTTYYETPDGNKYVFQGGNFVAITQEQFEDCCCEQPPLTCDECPPEGVEGSNGSVSISGVVTVESEDNYPSGSRYKEQWTISGSGATTYHADYNLWDSLIPGLCHYEIWMWEKSDGTLYHYNEATYDSIHVDFQCDEGHTPNWKFSTIFLPWVSPFDYCDVTACADGRPQKVLAPNSETWFSMFRHIPGTYLTSHTSTVVVTFS